MAKLLAGVASNRGKVTIGVSDFCGKDIIGMGGKWWQHNGELTYISKIANKMTFSWRKWIHLSLYLIKYFEFQLEIWEFHPFLFLSRTRIWTRVNIFSFGTRSRNSWREGGLPSFHKNIHSTINSTWYRVSFKSPLYGRLYNQRSSCFFILCNFMNEAKIFIRIIE